MDDQARARRIQDLFHRALEMTQVERDAFLATVCGDDTALREEVASLIAADPGNVAFLENPVGDLLGEDRDLSQAGEVIGQYRLLRELGRGGHGAVYLAEQIGGEIRREVAVKLLKRGMDTDEIIRRFRSERQILAGLKHPFIPHLYEAASTEDGRPYFVMEYVEGIPIHDYCQAEKLSIDQRLELFRNVCAAVQYAHQHFVVHRDLKPSNVLVTPAGEPKLLDFGIAKVLSPDGSAVFTTGIPGLKALTPAYASPEQLLGESITTATDVYSLGVMLYELLVGARPYQLTGLPSEEVRRLVCDQMPPPPSASVERVKSEVATAVSWGDNSKRWKQRLRGDLDTIVMMALRKEPERRYATVEQFSEDLDRFLRGLPVRAQRDTLPYRIGKFLRRNKLVLAAVAMFFIVTAAFLVNREFLRQEIERERDQAEAISHFLQDLFRETDTFLSGTSGDEISALDLLQRGANKAQQGEFTNDPKIRSAILSVMGSSFKSLSEYQQASALLEEALQIRQDHFGETHRSTLDTKETLAHLYHEQGAYERAESLNLAILKARRLEFGEDHPLVGRALNNIGLGLHELGRFEEALRFYEQTASIYKEALDPFDFEVASNLNNLARTYLQLGELQNAETAFLQVGTILASKLPKNDSRIANNLASLANLYVRQEQFEKAIETTGKALEIQLKVLPTGHPHTGLSYLNLGSSHRKLQQFEEAEELVQEALRIFQTSYPNGHKYTAYALQSLAHIQAAQGFQDQAEALYRDALLLFRATIPRHRKTLESAQKLAEFLEERGKHAEAKALRKEQAELDASHPEDF